MLQESAPGENLPPWIKVPKDLAKWGTARAVHEILDVVAQRVVKERNGRYTEDQQKLTARKLFHFHYADDAPMLTVGWLLYERGIQVDVEECRIYELPFVVDDGETPYEIDVPNLTHRERALLDSLLPDGSLDSVPLPPAEKEQYQRLYRHFPGYVDAVL